MCRTTHGLNQSRRLSSSGLRLQHQLALVERYFWWSQHHAHGARRRSLGSICPLCSLRGSRLFTVCALEILTVPPPVKRFTVLPHRAADVIESIICAGRIAPQHVKVYEARKVDQLALAVCPTVSLDSSTCGQKLQQFKVISRALAVNCH